MNIFAFIFILIAAVLFGIEALVGPRVPARVNVLALGLMFLSLGLMWQFASLHHSFHF